MLKNGIATTLVEGIPERIEVMDFPVTEKDILRVVDVVPMGKPAFYGSDTWDFSGCFKYVNHLRNVVDFRTCAPGSEEALKDFALSFIDKGNKIRTVSSLVASMNTCIRDTVAASGLPFHLLTDRHYIDYYDSLDSKYSTKWATINYLIVLYKVATANHIPHIVSVRGLSDYRAMLKVLAKHEQTKHFTPVPEAYLNRIITVLNRVMRDEGEPLSRRMTAGIMLVDTQVGVRSSEVPAIPADCVRYADTPDGPRPYFVYRSIKAARGLREVVYVEHIGTPLLFRTLEYLLELRKRSPFAGEDFLYVDDCMTRYPIRQDMLLRRYDYVIKMNMPEAKEFVEGIDSRRFRDSDEVWYIPSPHDFRTTVFSMLSDQGVPYPFIEKMMSHTFGSDCDDSYYGGIKKATNDVLERLEAGL